MAQEYARHPSLQAERISEVAAALEAKSLCQGSSARHVPVAGKAVRNRQSIGNFLAAAGAKPAAASGYFPVPLSATIAMMRC
jgi:hypothetical protein